MSRWPSTKARRVLAALKRIGWRFKRQVGSHQRLERDGWPPYTWAYADGVELGHVILCDIASKTGLRPEDL